MEGSQALSVYPSNPLYSIFLEKDLGYNIMARTIDILLSESEFTEFKDSQNKAF
jgi:hypothetical protein